MDDPKTETPKAADNDAILLLKIEEMVKTHMSQIDTLQEEISKYRDMFNDIFINNETFQEHDKIAKEASRIRSNTKKEIMKKSDVADIHNKLQDLRSEQKELQEGLSDYLREYQRLSGLDEIEGEDGEIRKIVYIARLVRGPSNFKPR